MKIYTTIGNPVPEYNMYNTKTIFKFLNTNHSKICWLTKIKFISIGLDSKKIKRTTVNRI